MRGMSQNEKRHNQGVSLCSAAQCRTSVCVLIKGTFKSGPCICDSILTLFPA